MWLREGHRGEILLLPFKSISKILVLVSLVRFSPFLFSSCYVLLYWFEFKLCTHLLVFICMIWREERTHVKYRTRRSRSFPLPWTTSLHTFEVMMLQMELPEYPDEAEASTWQYLLWCFHDPKKSLKLALICRKVCSKEIPRNFISEFKFNASCIDQAPGNDKFIKVLRHNVYVSSAVVTTFVLHSLVPSHVVCDTNCISSYIVHDIYAVLGWP